MNNDHRKKGAYAETATNRDNAADLMTRRTRFEYTSSSRDYREIERYGKYFTSVQGLAHFLRTSSRRSKGQLADERLSKLRLSALYRLRQINMLQINCANERIAVTHKTKVVGKGNNREGVENRVSSQVGYRGLEA